MPKSTINAFKIIKEFRGRTKEKREGQKDIFPLTKSLFLIHKKKQNKIFTT
jgi:hypothetical protein